jgi:RNA-directed DNA polymerase
VSEFPVYTRYVDDITLSGSYPIVSGSFPKLLKEILNSCGFKLNIGKDDDGRFSDGKCITKLQINRGRVDVRPDYLAAIHLQISDAAILAKGGECAGPYYTAGQIRGRILFVVWINPSRRRGLMKRYRSFPGRQSRGKRFGVVLWRRGRS